MGRRCSQKRAPSGRQAFGDVIDRKGLALRPCCCFPWWGVLPGPEVRGVVAVAAGSSSAIDSRRKRLSDCLSGTKGTGFRVERPGSLGRRLASRAWLPGITAPAPLVGIRPTVAVLVGGSRSRGSDTGLACMCRWPWRSGVFGPWLQQGWRWCLEVSPPRSRQQT